MIKICNYGDIKKKGKYERKNKNKNVANQKSVGRIIISNINWGIAFETSNI